MLLRCLGSISLSRSQFDPIPCHVRRRVLVWHQTEVPLGDIQPTMRGSDVSIFHVFVVQDAELPVRILLQFRVLVVGDLAENSHLFDEALQGADMHREARVLGGLIDARLLVLSELIEPDANYFLQLGSRKITERGIFASSLLVTAPELLFQAVTESFTQIREFLLIGKRAEGRHNLLPVREVRVMHNIPQVLSHNGREQAQIVGTPALLGEVRFLDFLDAFLASADCDHESI